MSLVEAGVAGAVRAEARVIMATFTWRLRMPSETAS
jgi:hypothetical protein